MNEPPTARLTTATGVTSSSPLSSSAKPQATAAMPTGQSTAGSHLVCHTVRCSHRLGAADK